MTLQDLGYYSDMNDIYYAYKLGYSFDNFEIWENHLYFFLTANSNYGKIYIEQINGSIINYSFTYQSKQGDTNI